MTKEEAINELKIFSGTTRIRLSANFWTAHNMAIKALEQESIDKSAMMHDIYMEGVNMSGEYQGCWVRFKDIKKIVDKYIGSEE